MIRRENYRDKSIWFIAEGRIVDSGMPGIDPQSFTGSVKEYRISELGRYLLNPDPVHVHKRLMGCKVYYIRPKLFDIKEKLKNILPRRMRARKEKAERFKETIVTEWNHKALLLKDSTLEEHFKKMETQLQPYNPTLKRIAGLDSGRIADLKGICEDIEGNRSSLNLKGIVDEKIGYIINNLCQEVMVILNASQISEGLFDLGGFDFELYNPHNTYGLRRGVQDGQARCCLLDRNDRVLFWLKKTKQVYYLQLLEQSVRTDANFRDAFKQCVSGDAIPLKLYFNPQLEIEYSTIHPPETYRQVFDTYPKEATWKNVLVESLRYMQLGIAFNYLLRSESGQEKLCTNISIMHNLRALDPIKEMVPDVYAEIMKKAYPSEAGRFYLLDAIKGYPNEK